MGRKHELMAGIVTVALLVSACAGGSRSSNSAPSPSGGSAVAVGAGDGKQAVERFMTAVKGQDLQGMSILWGTSRGAARDLMEREELEKRLIIIQCKLDHAMWEFAEDRPRLMAGGKQDFRLKIRQNESEATTSFTTIRGPANRWFVEIVDLEPLRDFCR